MKKLNVIFVLVMLYSLCCCSLSVFSQDIQSVKNGQEEHVDNIYIYTTWDDKWFYVAFNVESPNVNGTHTDFNKSIGNDDGVEVLFDNSKIGSDKVSPNISSFTFSVAGGFEFKKGREDGTFETKNIFTHRYASKVIGSLNNNSDIDNGFVMEIAIPWSELGMDNLNSSSAKINFKVRVNQKDYYLSSPDNYMISKNWHDLVLTRIITLGTSSQKRLFSARGITEPVINGIIKEGEWNKKSAVNIKVPIIGENPYKINFQEQSINLDEFYIRGKTTSFLDDPQRLAVIKSQIESKVNEGTDALAVLDDDYLLNIIEALNEIKQENGASYSHN